jgi:hypothetical protein
VALTIAARPETIFRYFTDPARFVRWMGDGSTLDAALAGPPADHIGLVQRMAGVARLVGRGAPEPCHGLVRFGWATGFWDPTPGPPEPPQRP